MGFFSGQKHDPYKDIRTYQEYLNYFFNYTPLYRHKNVKRALNNVYKIKDQELLYTIARDTEPATKVRDLALSRITDRNIIARWLMSTSINMCNEKISGRLDQIILDEIKQTDNNERLAEIACAEGMKNGTNAVRFAAIDKITSIEILTQISENKNLSYTPVRIRADERIETLNGVKLHTLLTEPLKEPSNVSFTQNTNNSQVQEDYSITEINANADEGWYGFKDLHGKK